MRKLLLILLFIVFMTQPCLSAIDPSIDNKKTYKNSYRWTGKPKDKLLDWAVAMEDAIDGTTGIAFMYFIPGTEPNDTKGFMYYDLSSNAIKVRTGSGYVALATASGNSLDLAYDAGHAITVDGTAVTLTVTANTPGMIINQNETSNDPYALSLIMAGGHTGTALFINSQGSGTDITADNWAITQAGILTLKGIVNTSVEIQTTADMLLESTLYDISFDASNNQMMFEDNAVLGLGGTHDAATADFTFKGDGTNLLVEGVSDDFGQIRFGSSNAIDVAMYDSGASGIALFDASAAIMIFTAYDITMNDGDFINFGTQKDFILTSDGTAVLKLESLTTDESGIFHLGKTGEGYDVKFWAGSGGEYMEWDAGNDALEFVNANVHLDDNSLLEIGSTKDFEFKVASTATMTVTPLADDETAIVNWGANQIGIDHKMFGGVTGSYMLWDSGEEELWFDKANIAFSEGDGLLFGDDLGVGDVGISSTGALLTFAQIAADTGAIAFGVADDGLDVTFYGDAGSGAMVWTEAAMTNGALYFTNANLALDDDSSLYLGSALGTGDFVVTGASDVLTFKQVVEDTGAVTWGVDANGMDVTWYGEEASAYMKWDATGATQLILHGVDESGTLLAIAGIDTTGNTDTVTIAHSGTEDALQITCTTNTSHALHCIAAAAQTTEMVLLNGATGAWLGNTGLGMLHITNDGTPATATTTLVRIAQTGTSASSQLGVCSAMYDTTTSGGGTSYALYVTSTNNEGLYVDTGKVLIDETLRASLGVQFGVGETLTAHNDNGAGSQIDDDVTVVNVTAVNANADDWILLPNDPPIGTRIIILCNAGSNFEVRTLIAGDDKINNVDCSDNAVELLATDTERIELFYVKADNWVANSYPLAGGINSAVTPN